MSKNDMPQGTKGIETPRKRHNTIQHTQGNQSSALPYWQMIVN